MAYRHIYFESKYATEMWKSMDRDIGRPAIVSNLELTIHEHIQSAWRSCPNNNSVSTDVD